MSNFYQLIIQFNNSNYYQARTYVPPLCVCLEYSKKRRVIFFNWKIRKKNVYFGEFICLSHSCAPQSKSVYIIYITVLLYIYTRVLLDVRETNRRVLMLKKKIQSQI